MNCMICKQIVPEGAVMCPNCGAMPWQAPEAFLNEDQHKAWLDAVYKPQLERWEKYKKLEKRLNTLEKELEGLKEKNAQNNKDYKEETKETQELKDIISTLNEEKTILERNLKVVNEKNTVLKNHLRELGIYYT